MKAIAGLLIIAIALASGCVSQDTQINETVKIGFIGPLTGSQAVYGQWGIEGAALAAEKLNRTGIKAELIFEDSKCDPSAGVQAYRKLVDVDNVDAIVSGDCSSPALAYKAFSEKEKTLLIMSAPVTPNIANSRNMSFHIRYTGREDDYAIAAFAARNNLTRAGILHQQTDAGLAYVKYFTGYFNGTVAAKESYNLKDTDFRSQIYKIKDSGPDFLVIYMQGDLGSTILKQVAEANLNVPVLTTYSNLPPSIIRSSGEAAEGVYLTLPNFESGSGGPEPAAFKADYYGRFGKNASYFTATAYDATMIAANALSECGEDNECIRSFILGLADYKGASEVINFDENGSLLIKEPMKMARVANGLVAVVE